VQADVTVLVSRRRDVLRPARIADNLVAGEHRLVVTLRAEGATVSADVVGLLDRREQFQRPLCGQETGHGPKELTKHFDLLGNFGFAAGRASALLASGDRGEPRLDALQVREDRVVEAIDSAVTRPRRCGSVPRAASALRGRVRALAI